MICFYAFILLCFALFRVEEVVRQEEAKKVDQIDEWKGIRDDLKPKISKQFVLLKQLKDKPVPFERVEIRLRGKEVKVNYIYF